MTYDEVDRCCGDYLTFRNLIEAGETWQLIGVPNLPRQLETVAAMRRLAKDILDPVITKYGPLEITYGFASRALTRHIGSRIDPARDQHAGHELALDGKPICSRLGQAVDFRVKDVCSGRIAAWIATTLQFDRLYLYGSNLPLHVSVGPQETRAIISMAPGPSGRRIPRARSVDWLVTEFGAF